MYLKLLLQITFCWGLFYGLYWVLFRQETFFQVNRFYLLASLILGIVIPNLELQILDNSGVSTIYYLQTVTVGVENWANTIVVTPEKSAGVVPWSWSDLMVGLYGLGVLFFGGKLLAGMLAVLKLYQASNKETCADYQLIKTNKRHLPFSFFNWLFWSQNHLTEPSEQQKILQHELAHIRQWHSIDVLLLELVTVFFWWNPLVWLYKKSIRTIHEYLADAAVLKTTAKKQYGHLLIRQSQSGMQVALANNFIHSQLKNRLTMMLKTKSKSTQLAKYLLVFPAMILLIMACSVQSMEAQQETKGTPPALESRKNALKVAEEMPRFAGVKVDHLDSEPDKQKVSNRHLFGYLVKSIQYPESAKKNNVEGKVVVSFIVDKTGVVRDAIIKQSDGNADMEAEALRVINEMPKWTPGRQNGEWKSVEMTLPIVFKFPKEGAEKALDFKSGEFSEMPLFGDCGSVSKDEKMDCSNKALFGYILNNLKYPKEAEKENAEGTVVVGFVINKEGEIENPEILKSVHPLCDAEVLRVTNAMPAWTPAKKDGKPVAIEYKLPVKFKLDPPASTGNSTESSEKEMVISDFKAFPNPAQEKLSLSFHSNTDVVNMVLTDAAGKVLRRVNLIELEKAQQTFTFDDIDVRGAARGLMTITLSDDKGKVLRTEKVMLQ